MYKAKAQQRKNKKGIVDMFVMQIFRRWQSVFYLWHGQSIYFLSNFKVG